MRRRWWIMGASLIVVIIAAIVLSMLLNRPEKSAAPDPASTGVSTIGKYGFPVSTIKAGGGGKTLAPDGVTPLGYGPSCDDAVRATMNYLKFMSTNDTKNPGQLIATYKLVFADQKAGEDLGKGFAQMAKESPGSVGTQASFTRPGLFKVGSCKEGETAAIGVAVTLMESSGASTRFFKQRVVFERGTWLLAAQDESTGSIETGGSIFEEGATKFPELTAKNIDELFTDSQGKRVCCTDR